MTKESLNTFDLKNENEGVELKKALFLQRFIAFLVDMLIVSVVVAFISAPFVDNKKITKLEDQGVEIIQKLQKNEIDSQVYLKEYSNVYYKLARNSGIISLVTILFSVLYFVVYQIYAKGQTFGKKLLKIKIISLDGALFMNQMIFRAFIANFILFDIISFAVMLFSPKSIYLYMIVFIEIIKWIITFISVIMIMNKKDGCAVHDKLLHTMVVREN